VDSRAKAEPAGTVEMRSGFLPDRIIHLHPTRLCNLACVHCYSQSGPTRRAALDPALISGGLELLRAEGYEVVSLSGGEPLVYRHLEEVVDRALESGFRVTMITNGILLSKASPELLSRLSGIAISFDGLAATHDEIRARSGAFDLACAALRQLADDGRPVGAAISLVRDAIPELPDLADHLAGLGARALQIRPVARAGRARGLSESTFYSAADQARLYLVAAALDQELGPEVRVHCDLAPARGLWQERDAYAGLLASCDREAAADRLLAELVNPLVITDLGQLKPIAYDFDGRFDIAPLRRLTADRLRRYKEEGLADFRNLIGGALVDLEGRHELVDWFDRCTRWSENASALGVSDRDGGRRL
jgi:pyruvate-formate lyase-activating enzyme